MENILNIIDLKKYVVQFGYSIKIRSNNIEKIINYRDYLIYLYRPNNKHYCYAWDVCYGEHWANQECKVFDAVIKFIKNDINLVSNQN